MPNLKLVSAFLTSAAAMVLTAGPLADADLAAIAGHMRQPGNWTWVFYGDSITHGAAHTEGWRSFVEVFQERLRYELGRPMDAVINSGNSGHTSVNLLNQAQYDWQVKRFQPNVVLVLIGMNDTVRPENGALPEFRSRLEALVDRIRGDGAIPVLQTYNTIQEITDPANPYRDNYTTRFQQLPGYNDTIREVAAARDVILIDHDRHWREHAANPEVLAFWLGEPIHPGARGHQEMAIVILQALGLYSPDSRCCRLEAGGIAPQVAETP